MKEEIARLITDAAGNTIATLCDAASIPVGTFWNNKAVTLTATFIESIVLSGTTPSYLQHANLVSGSVKVTDEAGVTVYTEGTDYTVNYTNGTITRIPAGAITDGQTVVVWYRYNILARDLQFYGMGYDRIPDETLATGKITIVEGWAHLFTDQYDTSQQYSLNDALRVNDDGRLTTAGAGPIFGKVIQVPTASYPLLGYVQETVLHSTD